MPWNVIISQVVEKTKKFCNKKNKQDKHVINAAEQYIEILTQYVLHAWSEKFVYLLSWSHLSAINCRNFLRFMQFTQQGAIFQ